MGMKELQEDLLVVGIGITTDNKTESTPEALIPELWQRFIQEGVADKVPNRIGKDVFVVYSNYEGEHEGRYDYLIGVLVSSLDSPIPGLKTKRILKGTYAVFETDEGPVSTVVPRKWLQIWQMFDDELGGKRTYKTDFEVYGKRARDPEKAIVEIYLGVE